MDGRLELVVVAPVKTWINKTVARLCIALALVERSRAEAGEVFIVYTPRSVDINLVNL